MSRQDIVDALLLKVQHQPTPEAAQHVLDVGLKDIASRYDGHSRDELAQVMAVYERSRPVFDEAIASAGSDGFVSGDNVKFMHTEPVQSAEQRFEDLVDEREPKAGDVIGLSPGQTDHSEEVDATTSDDLLVESDPDRNDDGHDDENGQFVEHRFTTRPEREEHMNEVFGEIAEDKRPPALTEVFGEVGDATASAEVVDPEPQPETPTNPEPTGHDDSNTVEPAPQPKAKKAKGKKSAEDLV